MDDYTNYKLTALIDLLAQRTETYTQMMNDGFSDGEDFAQIEKDILLLQKAILEKMGVEGGPENKIPDK